MSGGDPGLCAAVRSDVQGSPRSCARRCSRRFPTLPRRKPSPSSAPPEHDVGTLHHDRGSAVRQGDQRARPRPDIAADWFDQTIATAAAAGPFEGDRAWTIAWLSASRAIQRPGRPQRTSRHQPAVGPEPVRDPEDSPAAKTHAPQRHSRHPQAPTRWSHQRVPLGRLNCSDEFLSGTRCEDHYMTLEFVRDPKGGIAVTVAAHLLKRPASLDRPAEIAWTHTFALDSGAPANPTDGTC